MKIIGVNGSVNKTGNTFYMLDRILKLCEKEGAQTELINAAQAVSDSKTPFCVCCSTPCTKVCYAGTQLEQAYQKIEEADAVIFGSPVYFGSMTAQPESVFR